MRTHIYGRYIIHLECTHIPGDGWRPGFTIELSPFHRQSKKVTIHVEKDSFEEASTAALNLALQLIQSGKNKGDGPRLTDRRK